MYRRLLAFVCVAAAMLLPTAAERAEAQGGDWGTIKGTVVWGGDAIPPRKEIDVSKVDTAHCLNANPTADAKKQTILDESLLINAKNKGIKNVFVWIIEPKKIHPDLKKFPKEVTITQPACMYWPRAIIVREGQVVVVTNTATVNHNVRYVGDGVNNQGNSVVIKPNDKTEIKDLKAQRLPLPVECNIHGWMKGRIAVFNHPYATITDENGYFELKNAPTGEYMIMVYHEDIGYRLGVKGKNGEPFTIKAGENNMGELKMGK